MFLFKNPLCLYCFQPIIPNYTWKTVFLAQLNRSICSHCEKQLIKITEPTCRICHRPKNELNQQFFKGELCLDCIRWEDAPKWKGTLTKNISIYVYNDFMAELIAKFKYRGDYALAKVFAEDIRQALQILTFDLIVPIPLSEVRLYERGFNQAEALLLEAGVTPSHILKRTHTEKQSKKNRQERIHLPQVFQIQPNSNQMETSQPTTNVIKNKHILLVDDIYTTGSTLRHAAQVLKQAGAKSIQSLTLARG
ncbi:ComF family protein [Pallidibacillus thermolactis]|jgi:competence protein ComFC|uniref:ComF family protein n=1 Tax=Pallidibacillus thermolactis TaxID=251051 RepID=UPI0021DAB55C|nr:ComF family protein [Pallidibacillus thermolactis]MCU9600039.1 ComF family protein [Pallidibacillus thermolactis subsp. kokeshiiformis]